MRAHRDVDPHPGDRLGGRQPRLALGLGRTGCSISPSRSLSAVPRSPRPEHTPPLGWPPSGGSVMNARVHEHPVSLPIRDDLHRTRLTVFFRLLLAIPHFIWWGLWTIATSSRRSSAWLVALVTGRLPGGLHRFFCTLHQLHGAPLRLPAARHQPVPGVQRTTSGRYRARPQAPRRRRRSRAGRPRARSCSRSPRCSSPRRSAGPAAAPRRGTRGAGARTATRLPVERASLGRRHSSGWFVCVVKGQMPRGFRDTGGFVVGYWAQLLAYLLLVTDRYPNADPTAMLSSVERPPLHPVHVVGDCARSAHVPPDRLLPAAARDPAPLLARALERARGARRRSCSGS